MSPVLLTHGVNVREDPPLPAFDCFAVPNELTPITRARAQMMAGLRPTRHIIELPFASALDHVLAQDIRASAPVPPADNSAMDGFAIRHSDLDGSGVFRARIVGIALAGAPARIGINPGETIRIMTGAAMPEGADTVVPQESVETDSDTTAVMDRDQRPGQNVRLAGEDIKAGDVVLKRGQRIGAAELGVLASTGASHVRVFRPLRVAVFSTGDELREPGDTLGNGHIYDSNRPILRALIRDLGCEVRDLGILADDETIVRDALYNAARDNDVIVTSGGVSTGVADYVTQTLNELGQLGVWRIALRPGRPFAHGRIDNAEFFGLPGNPVAVMVTFDQLVKPALRTLAGEQDVGMPYRFKVRCGSPLRKRSGRTEVYRAILGTATDGELEVVSTGNQGSGLLTSMSTANCFIILDDDAGSTRPGDMVEVLPFS